MSFLAPEKQGEWVTRKISIIGAAKSIISQLKIGQDMTRVSLPAEFLYPYSILELGGVRALNYGHYLCEMTEMENPVDRIVAVARWYLSSTMQETFEKKPYNPILAESHFCWVEHPRYGKIRYSAEQTIHHPPVCAFTMDCKNAGIFVEGNITAGVKFHGNSVSMITAGPTYVYSETLDEQYHISSVLPSLLIKNVILGTKRESWDGEIIIQCKKTGYEISMTYKEEGWYCQNVVSGIVRKIDDPETAISTFDGPCGGEILINSGDQTNVLVNFKTDPMNVIFYPPMELLDDRNSLKLWHEVNLAIVDDDMGRANAAKRVIEVAQRERRANNTNFVPRLFELKEGTDFWTCKKDNVDAYAQSLTPSPENLNVSSLSLEEQQI